MHAGPLSGISILRFAHAYETGGGTERYLDDLDRALLDRNSMTIVRVHLSRNHSHQCITKEQIGRGVLVKVPLPILHAAPVAIPNERSLRFRLKQIVRDWLLYNPIVWRAYGAKWITSLQLPPRAGQAANAGRAVVDLLRTHNITLAMLHFFGGADADEVINEMRKADVPITLLNHYSNDRFLHAAIRKHVMCANRVAGVNGLDVPRYLGKNFTNLSDGIDVDFFQRTNALPLKNPPPDPIVLLPARVVREKGQMDLLRAAVLLRNRGVRCCIAFAGWCEPSSFLDELRGEISRSDLATNVLFLGGRSVSELRDWYASSAVVALPTYHHEGLPRVILEAQAMQVPVIAYKSGGVADGIISGKTGYLLRPGDVTGLAARLHVLLTSSSIPAAMGANGRAVVEDRFSLAALADRHERFYLKVITEARVHTAASATGQGTPLD